MGITGSWPLVEGVNFCWSPKNFQVIPESQNHSHKFHSIYRDSSCFFFCPSCILDIMCLVGWKWNCWRVIRKSVMRQNHVNPFFLLLTWLLNWEILNVALCISLMKYRRNRNGKILRFFGVGKIFNFLLLLQCENNLHAQNQDNNRIKLISLDDVKISIAFGEPLCEGREYETGSPS